MKTFVTAMAASFVTAMIATASVAAENCIDPGWQKIPGSNACHYTGMVNVTAQRSGDSGANEALEPNAVEVEVVVARDQFGNPIEFASATLVTDLTSAVFDGVRK